MHVAYAQNSCHKHYIFGKDSKPQSDAIVCYKITSYYRTVGIIGRIYYRQIIGKLSAYSI